MKYENVCSLALTIERPPFPDIVTIPIMKNASQIFLCLEGEDARGFGSQEGIAGVFGTSEGMGGHLGLLDKLTVFAKTNQLNVATQHRFQILKRGVTASRNKRGSSRLSE